MAEGESYPITLSKKELRFLALILAGVLDAARIIGRKTGYKKTPFGFEESNTLLIKLRDSWAKNK